MDRNRKISIVVFVLFLTTAGTVSPAASARSISTHSFVFASEGWTQLGTWKTWGTVVSGQWSPGQPLNIDCYLQITDDHFAALAETAKINPETFILLATAERTFDADGHLRQANDEKMSTLLTPAGLAIEGGIQGACTPRFGYDFRTPVDLWGSVPVSQAKKIAGARRFHFTLSTSLPQDLPPGLYRLRFDYGWTAKGRNLSLNCDAFAQRPFFKGRPWESHYYTQTIPASGRHASGRFVDASTIVPRVPWVILGDYNSNGCRGVVADEDKPFFALSNRNLIPDEIILPLYDDGGNKIAYSLEPRFPSDTIEARSNIPWDYAGGELAAVLTQPDGISVNLGRSRFIGPRGSWPTTGNALLTSWKPALYGYYTARVAGWIRDVWGNRYEGGGTYHFWIAKRMTLATATFQGQPYAVGGRYGRDIGFAPPVPADVKAEASLYVNSDPNNVITVSSQGRATAGGIFGSAQGAQPLLFTAPGEYFARILATYTDPDGHLWVEAMRHTGVIYPPDTTIVARGKKLAASNKFMDRGETHVEGYTDPNGDQHLVHITFPFQAGDVLLIASELQSSNKIEPVLTYEDLANPFIYDPSKLTNVGVSNLKIRTSNGLSPHMFPEYITEWNYYYGGAPRPGFMSRFVVGESTVRAPYWALSPNSFGGQINTSNNGDQAGDIYRLLGGVVVRKDGEAPRYAGYIASAFILPKNSNNNRIIAPGTEDLLGSSGEKARFFLVGLRPGMVYETGASFGAAVQIDPIVPADIRYTVQYPDGRTVVAQGTGDAAGSFAGGSRWTLDVPGVYKYWIEGRWNGFRGSMPGLPATGGEFYVIEKDRPAGAAGLKLDLPGQSTFDAAKGATITGQTSSTLVYFAAAIPGCVIDQGTIVPHNGRFEYRFDPAAISLRVPTYDIINMISGKPEIGRVVHLTFFARETTAQGAPYYAFARAIIRGTRIFYAK